MPLFCFFLVLSCMGRAVKLIQSGVLLGLGINAPWASYFSSITLCSGWKLVCQGFIQYLVCLQLQVFHLFVSLRQGLFLLSGTSPRRGLFICYLIITSLAVQDGGDILCCSDSASVLHQGCLPGSLEYHILSNLVLSQWWGTTNSEIRMFFSSSSSRDRGIFFLFFSLSQESSPVPSGLPGFLFFHQWFKVFCFLEEREWVALCAFFTVAAFPLLQEGGSLHSLVFPQLFL